MLALGKGNLSFLDALLIVPFNQSLRKRNKKLGSRKAGQGKGRESIETTIAKRFQLTATATLSLQF